MSGDDFSKMFLPIMLGAALCGGGDPKSFRRTILKIFVAAILTFCVFSVGYTAGANSGGWLPMPPNPAISPAMDIPGVNRRGFWYSWYYNDKGELLFKRGGKSNIQFRVNYSDGTTQDL